MTEPTKKKKPAQTETANEDGKSRTALWAAAGVGVGSAAVVAALLYANRSRLSDMLGADNKAKKLESSPILNATPETD